MSTTPKIQFLKLTYYDEARESDIVAYGAYEIAYAQSRLHGRAAGQELVLLFHAAYQAAIRKGLIKKGSDFDEFASTIAMLEPADAHGEVLPDDEPEEDDGLGAASDGIETDDDSGFGDQGESSAPLG